MYKIFKTTNARNLKFEDMISLHMDLCSCIFGDARSRGLGKEPRTCELLKFLFLQNGKNFTVKTLQVYWA